MPLRIEYVSPSASFYYNESLKSVKGQTGGGTVGGLPVFEGGHGVLESDQIGQGFWSSFLLPGIKAVGKQLLTTGSEIVKDKLQNPGTKLGAASKRRFIEGGRTLLDKGCKQADSYLEAQQSGSGCSLAKKRRVSVKRRGKTSNKRRTRAKVRKTRKRSKRRRKKTINKKAGKKRKGRKRKAVKRKYKKNKINTKNRKKGVTKRARRKKGKDSDLENLFY